MQSDYIVLWIKAALIRAVRTFAQTALACIGVSVCVSDVQWGTVLSMSLLSAILSVLTSLASELPELKDGEK